MPQVPSPTTRKRRLGAELRRLRDGSGVAAEAAAQELDCSVAKIRHVEGGRNAPSKSDLKVLVELYGGDAETLGALESIRKEASRPGWWSTMRLPKWLQSYVGAETDAHTVNACQLELVLGLLQIPAYARAMHEFAGLSDFDRRLAALAKRQERLTAEDNPLRLNAVISEGALRRLASEDFAKAQYRHLLTMSERSNVSLRVLPFSAGLHPSMSGGFVLLDFEPDISLPACYFEYMAGGQLVDDPALVQGMSTKFAELQRTAMSEQDSYHFIAEWI